MMDISTNSELLIDVISQSLPEMRNHDESTTRAPQTDECEK